MAEIASNGGGEAIDLEATREQIYYELGERGDKIAEETAALARKVRDREADYRDVEELWGLLEELGQITKRTERVVDGDAHAGNQSF